MISALSIIVKAFYSVFDIRTYPTAYNFWASIKFFCNFFITLAFTSELNSIEYFIYLIIFLLFCEALLFFRIFFAYCTCYRHFASPMSLYHFSIILSTALCDNSIISRLNGNSCARDPRSLSATGPAEILTALPVAHLHMDFDVARLTKTHQIALPMVAAF